jgi:hypothetical protein
MLHVVINVDNRNFHKERSEAIHFNPTNNLVLDENNCVREIQQRRIRWTGTVTCRQQEVSSLYNFDRKISVSKPLGRYRGRWEVKLSPCTNTVS